jgi:hypothetical protein
MRRWTLATATSLLLTVTACGSDASEEAETAVDDVPQSDAPLVPVEKSTDLVDPEGSVLGTAWIRDADSGGVAELEVQVAGLTEGFHGMHLYEVGSCEAAGPEAASRVLPPMLVLENGIGSITTLVGPESLDQLLEGDGVTVVINDAVAAAPEGLAANDSGSSAACGAFVE